MSTTMFYAALLVLLFLAYLLFKDTMNKIQYVQTIRIYWITRDNGAKGTPIVSKGFMRQTAPPWWQGSGIQFRAGKYTFQLGVLTRRGSDLLDQVGGRDMDDDARSIREWGTNG